MENEYKNNIKRTSTMKAASISVFVSIILFIIMVFGAQIILPARYFQTSTYYIVAVLLEAIPLGIGVLLYLLLTKQKFSEIIIFSKPQAKMNQKNMPWLIVLGGTMAIVGRYFIVGLQLVWYEFLEAVNFQTFEPVLPPIDSVTVFMWALLGIAVTPAIFEELIFRGILQKGLLRKAKPKNAILLSGLLFALMHLSVESFAFTFFAGLLLGYLAYKCGSIIPSMVFHFINNAFSVVGLYIMENNQLLNSEEIAEATQVSSFENLIILVLAVISAVLLGIAIWGFNKLSKSPPENPNMKPMKPGTIVFVVLSFCVLFMLLLFTAVLQNIVPM